MIHIVVGVSARGDDVGNLLDQLEDYTSDGPKKIELNAVEYCSRLEIKGREIIFDPPRAYIGFKSVEKFLDFGHAGIILVDGLSLVVIEKGAIVNGRYYAEFERGSSVTIDGSLAFNALDKSIPMVQLHDDILEDIWRFKEAHVYDFFGMKVEIAGVQREEPKVIKIGSNCGIFAVGLVVGRVSEGRMACWGKPVLPDATTGTYRVGR